MVRMSFVSDISWSPNVDAMFQKPLKPVPGCDHA